MRAGEVLQFLHEEIICSNKKDTSNFHGTVSFDPIKMSQKKKRLSNVRHTKVGNHFTGRVIEPKVKTIHYHWQVDHQNETDFLC